MARMHIVRPGKRSKKYDLHDRTRQPVVNHDKSHDITWQQVVKRDTRHELNHRPESYGEKKYRTRNSK